MFLLSLFLAVTTLTPDNPGERFTQPQIAVTRDLIGLTFGSGKTIYFSGSRDQGRTFSKPVKVAEVSAPALIISEQKVTIQHILETGDLAADYAAN